MNDSSKEHYCADYLDWSEEKMMSQMTLVWLPHILYFLCRSKPVNQITMKERAVRQKTFKCHTKPQENFEVRNSTAALGISRDDRYGHTRADNITFTLGFRLQSHDYSFIRKEQVP